MTSYETVRELFYHLIEEDESFFHYWHLTEEEAIALAEKRATNYMEEAVNLITMVALPQINFSDRYIDDHGEEIGFNFDLTASEKILIPSLMYQFYLDKDISKLKLMNVNFTSTDLKVFDPSNARSSFMEMYAAVKDRNDQLLDNYKNTDRTTGAYRTFDVTKYDIAK